MPNNVYLVDWQKLARMLVPPFLRKPKTLALLYALVSPIALLHNRFMLYRKNVQYRLEITPQVCRLEALLNDRWDYTQRRIYINKPVERNPVLLALRLENKPQALPLRSEGHILLPTRSEISLFVVDFTVNVPAGVPFDEKELRAYLANDVLPSKVYNIRIF